MVTIARDLSIHLPKIIAQLTLYYLEVIENALASLARKKVWFQYDYCFSGERIEDVIGYVFRHKRDCEHFSIKAYERIDDKYSSLPTEWDILEKVKARGKYSFLDQCSSYGYVVSALTDKLLKHPSYNIKMTKNQKRGKRRKKKRAYEHAFALQKQNKN